MNPLDQTPMSGQPVEQQPTPSVQARRNMTPFVAIIILVVVLLGAWIVFRRSDDGMNVEEGAQQAMPTTPTQDLTRRPRPTLPRQGR